VSTFIDRVDIESYKSAPMAALYSRDAVKDVVVEAEPTQEVKASCSACPFTRAAEKCCVLKIFACPAIKTAIISVAGGFLGAYLFDAMKKRN